MPAGTSYSPQLCLLWWRKGPCASTQFQSARKRFGALRSGLNMVPPFNHTHIHPGSALGAASAAAVAQTHVRRRRYSGVRIERRTGRCCTLHAAAEQSPLLPAILAPHIPPSNPPAQNEVKPHLSHHPRRQWGLRAPLSTNGDVARLPAVVAASRALQQSCVGPD